MSEKIYRCGIIGLGRQGAGIPSPHTTDPARKPWTHKMAYEMHPGCILSYGIDSHFPERNFANKTWAEIVSICTPADWHKAAIRCLLTEGSYQEHIKAIFCEKPLAPTVEECDTIIEWCQQRNVILAVNHQRAWEMKGEVIYSGDSLETGSHAAELSIRMGFSILHDEADDKFLSIDVHSWGPLVSLRAIDDIIACIEGKKEKPACDGWAGREAVRVALESVRTETYVCNLGISK